MKNYNARFAERKVGDSLKRHNEDMYILYEEYKETLKNSKKPLRKRQKLNADMREEYESPFDREDYNLNKNDITSWNSMINELEEDMKMMEMYLDFDDRALLHRDYNNMKSMIYNQNSYEGEIPLETLYGASVPDTTDIVCDVEIQEEIVELLDKVLTDRQRQVVEMYFFDCITQEKIGEVLGLERSSITKILQNSLGILRNCINISEFI